MKDTSRHFAAAAGFVALAVAWSFPLVAHLSSHLPGAGIGDNAFFVWNFWWMRTSLASGSDFLRTSYLFAPVGVDLTLHTHTAFLALVGATLLKPFPVVTALNLTTLGALALNGFCAYLLAWRLTRQWGAALVGGLIFGSSPYVAAHLHGHFNLTSVWPLPLFALTVAPAIAGSKKWAALSGVVLSVTAYVDYYYVVYELALTLCLLILEAYEWSLTARAGQAASPWLLRIVGGAMVVDITVIVAIVATGGFSVRAGSIGISMKEIYNPLQLLWVCIGLTAWIRVQARFSVRSRETWSWGRSGPALLVLLGVFLFAAAPLVWKGAGLVLRGQYVTQQYYWRSAPAGVDAATLVFGNPFHGLWGGAVQRLYAREHGINLIEGGAWLGLAPLALTIYVIRRRWTRPVVRQWAVIGAVFFLWALGPHLMVLGRDTALILPEAFLRYVPLVSNARIPGRAMALVSLSVAMLSAMAAAAWSATRSRPTMAVAIIGFVVLADFWVAPFPLVPVECPSIYQTLGDRPEQGALAELPLPLGDGLMGELTPVDHRILVCQMVHGRPLVGGVLARLPSNVLPAYEADPLLHSWLELSGAKELPGEGLALADTTGAAERLRGDGIAFVMLNRATASPQLREYVEHVLPLTLVAQEQDRALYLTTR